MSLHTRIEKFLKASEMPPTRFGRLSVGDPRLVKDLRRGREPGASMIERVEAFLAAQGESQ